MEQLDHGIAGICRETYRVLHRAILPSNNGVRRAAILSALFLAQANHTILSLLDADDLVLAGVSFTYPFCRVVLDITLLLLVSLICTAAFVHRLALGDCHGILPRAPLERLLRMCLHVTPLAMSYSYFCGAASLVLMLLDPSNELAIILPLRVIGGAAYLAGVAYFSVVLHIACVVPVLEAATFFGALRKSRALLAGKFWVAAAIFVPLDVCYVALQTGLLQLTREDALGFRRGFQVAAGAAMAAALWAVVVVTMVAQLVVYLVCKNHHYEVVVVDIGAELQPVKTEQIPPAGQSPAGTST